MPYLLATVFFVVPLVFSHFFRLFGLTVVFDWFGNYEGLKLAVFSVLLTMACGIFFLKTDQRFFFRRHEGLGIALGTAVSVFVIHVLSGTGMFGEFLWAPPFFSGFLWIFLLCLFLFLLSQSFKEPGLPYEKSALAGLFAVLAYAGIQRIGLDPIDYGMPFESGRVFSTLGNPNTCAVYCLLFLPLISLGYRSRWRWLAVLLILIGIATSGSASVFSLAVAFLAWAVCHEAGAPRSWYAFCFLFLGISWLQWAIPQLGQGDKYLSLMTRFAIWNEGFRFFLAHPAAILWGAPQSEMIAFLNEARSENLLRYLPRHDLLLHLHHTWFDLFAQFGIVGLAGIGLGLAEWFRKLKIKSTAVVVSTLVLFIVSGCFHHLEIANWIILSLVVFSRK